MISDIPGFQRDQFGKPQVGIDDLSVYAFGNLIRRTEELILELFSRGLLSGTTHTCLGQEICQMAVVRALNDPDDVVLSNHRNHGHFLTYSGYFTGLVAEVMGRKAGVCGGYGGSQHITFRRFHSNGVQGGMTGIGTGIALANKMRGSKGLVTIMIGDGTLGEGLLYESMNLASIWQVPVLFVVENNGIAQTTHTNLTTGGSIEARGQAFGLLTRRLDDSGKDFLRLVSEVVEEVRGARRPGMLVIDTHRLGPHSKGDDLRNQEERNAIAARDPLAAVGRRLSASDREKIDARNAEFLRQIELESQASPEASFDTVPLHSFRKSIALNSPEQPARAANVRSAINVALRDLLREDSNVIVLGEDLHEPYGGAFKVTAGLSKEFPDRVISTPISEAGITGSGIGLALAGKRPIVEIMLQTFYLCAWTRFTITR